MPLKSFLGVGAFDHLEWTYNGAFEQLLGLGRGEFEKKMFKNSNARGGGGGVPGGGMFNLRFDWYIIATESAQRRQWLRK